MKKKFLLIPLVVVQLVILSGATLSTRIFAATKSDYDRGHGLGALKTWDFKDQTRMPTDPVGTNTLWNQRIRQAIEQQFSADGFTEASGTQPDFLVAYYLDTRQRYDTRYINYGFPGRWRGWGWGGRGVDVWQVPYNQSTLVVDIIDPSSNQMIWRGYDVQTVDFNKSDETIRKAADHVVKRFVEDVKRSEKEKG